MSTGVLSVETLKRISHANTGFFETSKYTEYDQMYVTSGNHDQAGLIIGNLQYNFGPADRAQDWFTYMITNHMDIVNTAFGANTVERDEFINVIQTYTRENRIIWGDSISALVNNEKRALQSPYKEAFGYMLTSAEGIAYYQSMADFYYFDPSYELFRHLPCNSRFSLGSLYDTYVNKGRYYPVNLLVADFDAIDADNTLTEAEKEIQKNYQINYRGNYDNAVNPTPFPPWQSDQEVYWHGDGVDDGRRGCMANRTGTYYGVVYDPIQFDMNLETATAEKLGITPVNIKLGNIDVSNVYLGTTPISSIYLGANLIGGGAADPVYSSRVPTTQFRSNPASWIGDSNQTAVTLEANQPLWIDVQEPFVGCRTYYTTDGTEPTEQSNLYTEALKFTETTTLKTKTISVFGIAEVTKTCVITVPSEAQNSWRYLKIEGYGSVEEPTTTRIIEVQVWEGATNVMANATILSHDPVNAGGTIGAIKDGIRSLSGYPIWWLATPNANVVVDFGAQKALTKLNYYSYSATGVQRTNRFKILASNTNNGTDWTTIWDNSTGTLGAQPILPEGYELVL